jgi:hypothetical protein
MQSAAVTDTKTPITIATVAQSMLKKMSQPLFFPAKKMVVVFDLCDSCEAAI